MKKEVFLRCLLCSKLKMGFDCMIMKERVNTIEQNDIMTISNYLSTVLINLLYTYTLSLIACLTVSNRICQK